jgi:hypothetical protein
MPCHAMAWHAMPAVRIELGACGCGFRPSLHSARFTVQLCMLHAACCVPCSDSTLLRSQVQSAESIKRLLGTFQPAYPTSSMC